MLTENNILILQYNIHAENPKTGENYPFANNGYEKIANAILNSSADIVCAQEVYDKIGDNTLKYLPSSWRFKKPDTIVHTGIFYNSDVVMLENELYDNNFAWNWYGALFSLKETGAKFRVFSTWLSSDKYGPELLDLEHTSKETVNKNEENLRTSTLRKFYEKYQEIIIAAREPHGEPVILCGDHNSPSHLDSILHRDRGDITWPSIYLNSLGFMDSLTLGDITNYKPLESNSSWSSIYKIKESYPDKPKEPQDRIDFIYSIGAKPLISKITSCQLPIENTDITADKETLRNNSFGSDHLTALAKFSWLSL